jgi:hypothetical protein
MTTAARRNFAWAVALLTMFCSVASAADDPAVSQINAVLTDYSNAMAAFTRKYMAASAGSASAAVLPEWPKTGQYSLRLLKIARENPASPARFDAMQWIVEHEQADRASLDEALNVLSKDYAADARVGVVVQQLIRTTSPAAEAFLRAVMKDNPDRVCRGTAVLMLGRLMKNRAQSVAENHPDAAVQARRKSDTDAAESLFTHTMNDYSDIVGGSSFTLGQSASDELFEMRSPLAVGKVAPEIQGEDIDGKPMKLSEFRGKVVMLDFWGDW